MIKGRVLLLLSLMLALGPQGAMAQDRQAVSQHVFKGNQLMSRHQYQSALEEYEAASKLDPNEPVVRRNIIECHNNWGTFLFRQRKYEDAIAEFENCLALDPRHSYAKHNLTLVHQAMEQEGIPVPEAGTRGGREKPAEKEKPKDKPKTEEPAAKISASSSPADPATAAGANTLFGSFGSTSGSGLYMSGSPLYPTYKKTGSAGAVEVNRTPTPTRPAASAPTTPVSMPASTPVGSQPGYVPAGFTGAQNASVPTNADAIPPEPKTASQPAIAKTPPVETKAPEVSAVAAEDPPAENDPPPPGSIEEKISELEKNITGKVCCHMSYLKRLEQMEIKLFKQPRSGTLDERVEFLRKKVGL